MKILDEVKEEIDNNFKEEVKRALHSIEARLDSISTDVTTQQAKLAKLTDLRKRVVDTYETGQKSAMYELLKEVYPQVNYIEPTPVGGLGGFATAGKIYRQY